MRNCKICANEYCTWHGRINRVSNDCLGFEPQTNADRIRSMTDEELAKFIGNQRGRYCDFKDPSEEEAEKVLPWLKSPVEVEK